MIHYFEFVLQKNTRVPCNGLLLYVNLKVFKQQGHSPFLDNIFKYSYPSLVISSSRPFISTLPFNKIFESLLHKKYIYLGFLPNFILASRAVRISFHIDDKKDPISQHFNLFIPFTGYYTISFFRCHIISYRSFSFLRCCCLCCSCLFISTSFSFPKLPYSKLRSFDIIDSL